MKIFFNTTVAVLALSGTALAADLGTRRADPVAPVVTSLPMFTWAGMYAGVSIGGAIHDNNVSTRGTAANTITNVAVGARPASVNLKDSPLTLGGQIGYNWQIGQFVYGVEGDITSVSASRRTFYTGTTSARSRFLQELDWIGTARVRAGYAIDRLLIYATAGLAYGHIDNHAVFLRAVRPERVHYSGRTEGVKFGYAIGAGVEYAVTNNISLRGEYLFYDLGEKTVNVARRAAAPAGGSYVSKFENHGHLLRAGLNYKF